MTQVKNMSKNANNFGAKRTSKYAAIQFFRTALCNDFMYGRCPRGEKCTFAHGEKNLATRPTLSKTKMCPHRSCSQKNCGYAHSRKELVSTGSFWKTEMCRFGQLCKIKNTCRFAHDETELRPKTHNGESIDPAQMVEQMHRTIAPNNSARGAKVSVSMLIVPRIRRSREKEEGAEILTKREN